MAHSSISGGSCAPRLCQRSHRSARRTVCLAGAAAVHHAQQHNAVFPHTGTFSFNGKDVDSQTLIDLLAPFMTEERIQRIQRAVAQRTYNVVPVVEGLYDMGNLAACCRSADAFGLGAVHAVNRSETKYKQSARTSAGAHKWLDVTMWKSTQECVAALKAANYQLVVTHLSKSSVTIQEVDFTRPTAFVLGNEKEGVSEEMVAAADACAIIPMAGFVESFNISVAGALVMYEAQQQRIRKLGRHGDLTHDQQLALQASLMMRSLKSSETLVGELLSRPPPSWQAGRLKSGVSSDLSASEPLAAAAAAAAS